MSQPNQHNTPPFPDGGAAAVELYESGLSMPAVAKRLGVNQARIARLFRSLNVPRRSCNDHQNTSHFGVIEVPIVAIISLEDISALYRGRTYE